MQIKVLGWEYKNIRKMKNLEVKLEKKDGTVHPVTLVMMKNGTGKTTTIKLMRALLSGSAKDWDAKTVRSFRGTNDSFGEFRLTMSFKGNIYHYILKLNYEDGTVSFETSSSSEGLKDGREFPYELGGVFDREEFVNRFIFDGEQAKKTLSTGNEEAERAITYLYQVNKLDDMVKEINDLVQEKQMKSTGSDRSLKVYKGKMDRKRENYNRLCITLNELKQELKEKNESLDENNQRYKELFSSDRELHERREELIRKKKELYGQLGNVVKDVLLQVKRPYNIHPCFDERLKGLFKNMQTLKLPKSTSREFFDELADSHTCICGREIGEREREKILENAKLYLVGEQQGALNMIKSSLKEYEISEQLNQDIFQMRELNEKLEQIESGLNSLEIELSEKGNDELTKIRQHIDLLLIQVRELESQIEKMETTEYQMFRGLNEENNVNLALKAWEDEEDKYLKDIETYKFTKKADRMISYIKQIKGLALKKLKNNIMKETNEKIKKIITNDTIIISKIDRHLILKDREEVSEGQTLAVAYAYIGSLFEHSYFDFPFIVDSPAASMDLGVRREVANVIPELFKQLVVFVTSGEVAGFAEAFYELNDVQYMTIEDTELGNVVLVPGREYFSKYQMVE